MSVAFPDEFDWQCANVLIGNGDAYSTAAAEEFLLAARSKNIDVCTQAEYVHNSGDMSAAIKKIIDNRCCTVTVVFGQTTDLAALFLEAHKQNYGGEWVVGDWVVSTIDVLINEMKRHSQRMGARLSESQIHEVLRGILVVETVSQCLRANRA